VDFWTIPSLFGAVSLGGQCRISIGNKRTIPCEVVGFRDGRALVMPLGVPIPPSPDASAALLEAFAERGISWHPGQLITELDPARKVAVLRYSGSWSQERYECKLKALQHALETHGLRSTGLPEFARFNSPFQLWFLRRNEIWITLAQ